MASSKTGPSLLDTHNLTQPPEQPQNDELMPPPPLQLSGNPVLNPTPHEIGIPSLKNSPQCLWNFKLLSKVYGVWIVFGTLLLKYDI